MTEQAEPAPEPFAIVPTHEWGLDIERRVHDLESGTVDVGVAKLPPELEEQLLDALRKLDARQTRHREELEALKGHVNMLVDLIRQILPATSAPTEGSPL